MEKPKQMKNLKIFCELNVHAPLINHVLVLRLVGTKNPHRLEINGKLGLKYPQSTITMAYGKKHAEARIISVMLKSKHNKIGIDFTFCQ